MDDRYKRYTVIKFDYRNRRISLIHACVATLLTACGIIVAFSPISDKMGTTLFALMTLGGAVFCPVMAVIGWLNFAMGSGYLKRLRVYGYEVPECKRMYKGLEELSRNAEIPQRRTGNSMESIVLSVICWVIAAGSLAGGIPFYVNYKMQEIGFVFCGAAAIFWVVLGLHYFRQRSREKYRDDVEPEPPEGTPRKVRTHLAEGIATILLLAFVTWVILVALYSLCGVIFRARLLHKTDY